MWSAFRSIRIGPWRGRGGYSAESYRLALDQIIDWAASLGAYTLLDLQWLDADTIFGRLNDGSPNRIAPLPSPETIGLWSILAERYRDEPAVLFDLYNEPHHPLEDDASSLHVIGDAGDIRESSTRRVRAEDWRRWARKLIDTIRPYPPVISDLGRRRGLGQRSSRRAAGFAEPDLLGARIPKPAGP